MRNYFILLACLVIISCKQAEETCCPEDPSTDPAMVTTTEDQPIEDSAVVKITESLNKSINIEKNIKSIVKTNTTLYVQNIELTEELKTTKDSLQKVTIELKETKSRIPNKRSFFQKVLGVAKDSVEIIKTDTIQTN